MAGKKDYYDVLGVSKNASKDDIKSAYRKLAREHHPDMVKDGDKKTAEARFKEINEAYQVLGDEQKKKMYDQFGHAGPGFAGGAGATGGQGGFGGFGGAQGNWGPFTYTYSTSGGNEANFDPLDIFEEFFGFRGFGGQRRPKKGKNLYYELHVDFGDAVRGAERELSVESGKITIKIPKGARNGTELRFAGKGMPGPEGAQNGDLYITLRVQTPKEFERSGDNIATIAEVDIATAVLGGEVEVPVIDPDQKTGVGKAKLKIPAGTQPNTPFRLKGKGMPSLRGYGQGDAIVYARVKIPQRLSRKQKKLMEDFGKG